MTETEGTGIYVRWKQGEPRVGRTFPPMPRDHPMADEHCPACGETYADRETVLIVLGPGADPEAVQKHNEGRWYSAESIAVHAACAGVDATLVPVVTNVVKAVAETHPKADPDTGRCGLCQGVIVYDEDNARLVCSTCGVVYGTEI